MSDDFALLEAWRDGKPEAGSELLRRHFSSLYRFFANKVDSEVDDLLQKTMLACVNSRDRFRGEASFRTYLFTIARHELYAYFRRLKRERERIDPNSHSLFDLGHGPSTILAKGEEQRLLLIALRRIPLDLQIAVELFYWEGLGSAELSEVLEIPIGTVKSRLRRAKEKLRTEIQAIAENAESLERTLSDLDGWARAIREQLIDGLP